MWVVPGDEADVAARCERLSEHLNEMDWRLYGVVVVPVTSLADVPDGLKASD